VKIDQIAFYHAQLKLKQPFTTSLSTRTHANNVFVRIRTNEGIIGWGECSPNLHINGETIETCFAVGKLLGQQLIGIDPRNVIAASELMNSLIYGNSSIKSAIDLAVHDIAARAKNQPLYQFLGGSIKKKIYTDYTVSLMSVEKMVADALAVKAKGFPIMKVKLGDNGKKDIQRIKSIREAVGKEITIRIDANQGWGVQEAIDTLNGLAPYNIEYCEEPIARHSFLRLKQVREASPILIMADESCSDHHDAKNLIDLEACDYFNIKLGKSSGLINANKIIQHAEAANMKMQIGGFLESKLLCTANCHLAYTSDQVTFFDFDSPLFIENDPVIGGMQYQSDWEITLPNTPGLGVEVDSQFLKTTPKLLID
jgi:L-Ala-D/L-Glu epimerase / N-acetyl-D-glutamate racemase